LKNGRRTKQKKIKLAIETSKPHGVFSLFVLFYPYFKEGNLKKSEEFILKALEINQSIHNMPEIAINLVNIGCIYHMHGIRTKVQEYYSKAEEYYFKSLEHLKTTGQGELSTIYFNLGLVYQEYYHDPERARDYFKQALKEDYEWHRWKYLIQDCVSLSNSHFSLQSQHFRLCLNGRMRSNGSK
jgi:tetratricopeptide (TPR) repeat protein